ncbi:helicase C-terminal domain-containing protein [Candidatus Latescibacterota bacterium]
MKSSDTFVSFDVETTGLDPKKNEIIEIGAVKVENGEFIEEYSEFVYPGCPIPDFITHLTGISDSDVAEAESIQTVLPTFLDFADGYILLGQNVNFDISFINNKRMAYKGPFIDNIELARILLPQLHSYSLENLIDYFNIKTDARHRALEDAKATAEVFLLLLDILRESPADFANDLLKLSNRTKSSIGEVLEADVKERISADKPRTPKKKAPLKPAENISDNVYGDFYNLDGDPPDSSSPKIDPGIISAMLTNNGALSKHHKAYEEREGQISLSTNIAKAFNDSEIMLAEAGTGIGKSIAYLIPSILWAEKAKQRVIISTNTKNLQEQLFTKDIPLIGKMLDMPFRAVILKGRGNYICRNRMKNIVNSPSRFLSKKERSLLLPVASWLTTTKTGDLSETGFFPFLAESGLMEKINSDSPTCLGTRCKFREKCFVTRVRKAAQVSHIIIVNHSLVFSDMISSGGVLGPYNRIVFDEAHNIEKTAIRFLGVTLNHYRVRRILNHLISQNENAHGLLPTLDDWVDEMTKAWPEFSANKSTIGTAIDSVEQVHSALNGLFDNIYHSVRAEAGKSKGGHEGKLRYFSGSSIFNDNFDQIETFKESLNNMIAVINDVLMLVSGASESQLNLKEEMMFEIEDVKNSLQAIVNDVDFLVEAGGVNVFWFEYNDRNSFYSLKINSAPLNVNEKLAHGLYDKMETVIMASATLTVAGDFSYIESRLGINLDSRERTAKFIAPSPFDYESQSAVIIPSFVPSPKENSFIKETNEVLYSMAKKLKRGMLVLFTSRSHLNQSYMELRDKLTRSGITLLAQGMDGSRTSILKRFQKETGSVLFGTDSFWEGVDVPGDALEIVVIVRLPFAVPSDPVIQAQMEEIEKAGGNPFMDFSVPEAAIKLRQGAGRLIRHRNDKGAVVMLDNRIITTRYGSLFRKSLSGKSLEATDMEMLIGNLEKLF